MIENLLMYMCAKHCHKRWSSDKAIAKIKRCNFFASQCIHKINGRCYHIFYITLSNIEYLIQWVCRKLVKRATCACATWMRQLVYTAAKCRQTSGGVSEAKKPGHFEVRTSLSQVTRVHFFPQKSWRPFLVVALKTQSRQRLWDCFTVKIKQNSSQRSDMVKIFIFLSHYYQSKAIGRMEPGQEPGR